MDNRLTSPAAPESETPETDAYYAAYLPPENKPGLGYDDSCGGDIAFARSLERRLSLAQTEIKGHMRVKDDLQGRIAELEKALSRIAKWFGEFPPTGDSWTDGSPVSYGAAFGSNGERDYMRSIAKEALKSRA